MLTRRKLLAGTSLLLAGCAAGRLGIPARENFVRRDGMRFLIGPDPYRYVGTNMWYAAYLGADAPYGNRARLRRELDRLAALGVDNLRILGSSELSPFKGSISPAFRTRNSDFNETLLRGLDYALAEIGRRNMRAVVYLTNFWEWSGGMGTYLYWTNGGRYIDMNDPAHPWPAFADFVSGFYSDDAAVRLYHDYVRSLVGRRNSITEILYIDDPAIMSWQLANEPRPGGSEAVGVGRLPAYLSWINGTARLIKSLDPNHMVSTGSEGLQGCLGMEECVIQAHGSPEIDYVTAHIWPQNWGWADPRNLPATWVAVETNTRDYLSKHVELARRLGKPLVIEEFGFPRDGGSFDAGSTVEHRNRFFSLIYDAVAEGARTGGPMAGTNFWAWGGEGRTQHADNVFRHGDVSYMGDPPHEPQGWYSVLDSDMSTHALIRAQRAMLVAGS